MCDMTDIVTIAVFHRARGLEYGQLCGLLLRCKACDISASPCIQARVGRETQIRELELRIARLEWAAARQEALTPELKAAMEQRLARVQGQVAVICRTLDGETKRLADFQRLIAVKQQVGGRYLATGKQSPEIKLMQLKKM